MCVKITEARWRWNSFLFGVKQHWFECATRYYWVSIGFFSFYIVPKDAIKKGW